MDRAAVRGPLSSELAESSALRETTLDGADDAVALSAPAAVLVEDVPDEMDSADEYPQLNRLQQQQAAGMEEAEAQVTAAQVVSGGVEQEMTVESAPESGVAEGHSRMEQQQEQQEAENEEQHEQLQDEEANVAAVQDAVSTSSPLLPHPPPATTEGQAHSFAQAATQPTTAAVSEPTPSPAASTAATTTATLTPEPSAYMAPLFNHIEQYRTAHTARLDQYEADLRTFDRVAVVPWLNAAVRHLKQQEEEKKELSENGARMLQEIRDFVETMGKWREMTRGRGPRQPEPEQGQQLRQTGRWRGGANVGSSGRGNAGGEQACGLSV